MTINTTNGPVTPGHDPYRHHQHVTNTTAIYEDEDELLAVVNAQGWSAEFEDGRRVPLVLWAVMDTGRTYGVVVGADGTVDATQKVEKYPGFSRYTNEAKEK